MDQLFRDRWTILDRYVNECMSRYELVILSNQHNVNITIYNHFFFLTDSLKHGMYIHKICN
jgi:hypothetical protein